MGTFLVATKSVLPLFMIIVSGILFSKTKAASPNWVDVLNKYALWIGFPALIIASLMKLDISGNSYMKLIMMNSAYIVVSVFLAYPIAKVFGLSKKMRSSLFLVLPFGNVAYLGMPVLRNVFGDEVLPVAAILATVFLFWLFTLAIALIEIHETNTFKAGEILLNLLKNPLLISVIVSVLIITFKVKLPGVVEQTIHLFAQSVTALVLFSLGIFLGFQNIGKVGEWLKVLAFSVVIILLLPGIYFLILRLIPGCAIYLKESVIAAAMPAGITSYVLAARYNLEAKFIARLVVLTTLMAIVVLPLWIVVTGAA